jgi:two-component system chemotaxis response regulator CheY
VKKSVPNSQDGSNPGTLPDPRRLRALVVDDDVTCRILLEGLLSKYGECHSALNGAEAIKAFKASLDTTKAYDLICMDIEMPDMDGNEAVTQIRSIEEHSSKSDASEVKILMTTSIQDLKIMFQSFTARCDDYLTKPVDGRKLEQKLISLGLFEE